MAKRLETLDLLRGILFLNMMGYHWQYISGFISGSGLSKNVLKNGAKVLSCALVITIGSLILMPESAVWFGILTLIATGYITVYLFDDWVKKLPQLPLFIVFVLLFCLIYPYRFGNVSSLDYFALSPWLFLFWSGRILQRMLGDRVSQWRWMHIKLPVINWVGQHTLIGYLLHLPLLAGIALLGELA